MFMQDFSISFLSADSSVKYEIRPNGACPFWGEVHIHFGKYNVVHITVVLTSEKQEAAQGTQSLADLIRGLYHELYSYFGFLNRGVEIEAQLTVYYHGIRVAHAPEIWGNDFEALAGHTKELIEDKLAGKQI